MRKIVMKGVKSAAASAGKSEPEFVQAGDGAEALEQLSKTEDVDFVLCDINMPNMDGIEFVGCVRDEKKLDLATAIHRMTARAAKVLALEDRGVLQVGKKADINVLDIDRVEERQPRVVQDFPHGKSRLVQPGAGYLATVVNGQVLLEANEPTGAEPGQLLRGPLSR